MAKGKKQPKGHDLTIIIPAAGVARRMRSLGVRVLLPISDGETVLSRLLRISKESFPAAQLTVVAGHEAARVFRALPADVVGIENELHEESTACRSLELALRACNRKRVLVLSGDIVFSKEMLEALPEKGSAVVVTGSKQIGPTGVGVVVQEGKVTNFAYAIPNSNRWAKVVLLEGNELFLLRKILYRGDRRRHLLWEVMNTILDGGGEFLAVDASSLPVVEIDTSKDISRASQVAQTP